MGYQKSKEEVVHLNDSKIIFFHQFVFLMLVGAFLAFTLSGCGQNGKVNGVPAMQLPEPADISAIPQQVPPEPATTPKSILVTVTETDITDVLIVVDNSASMRFEQANMADRFGSLLEEMKGLNWRLAIITTDVSSNAPKKDGRLLEFKTMPGVYYLTSEMPEDEVKAAFASTIQRPSREGNANEQGIKATYRSIERGQDWMRPDGSFNVVVVSDADETPAKNTTPDTRNNPNTLLSYINTQFPNKPFYFHSIIVKEGDAKCLEGSDNEGYGRTYAWLSEKTGGVIGNVCEEDYSNQLKMIGEKVSQKVKSVELECLPVEGSVTVRNDLGHEIPAFEMEGPTVQFSAPLPVGHNTINYTCP